jgi:hypothetical protein
MKRRLALLATVLVLQPSAAIACSCIPPEELTERQLRSGMADLSLVAYGRIIAVEYPPGCRVAPLRWAYSLAKMRLPVTYTVAVRETLWGQPVATTRVVQHQLASWDACKPLGSPACQPVLPFGDALWALHRMSNGEQTYAGQCGLTLASYYLRLGQTSVRSVQP